MVGSQKSKRITWAPDSNLCQLRLYSTSKPPSEVGMGTRACARPCLQSADGHRPDEELPPGFHDFQPANLLRNRIKRPQIPFTKWRCPPRFEVNSEWQVVSGEESKEIETQNERERRVLEAIYPGPSAIPPSPRAPADAGEFTSDDRNTPLVPLTPIEEADAATSIPMIPPQPHHHTLNGALSSQSSTANNIAHSTQVVQPDVVSAALASVLSSTDQMNFIDHDLLLRILSNPHILQKHCYGASSSMHNVKNASDSTKIIVNGGAPLNAPPMAAAAGPFHPPQLRTGFDVHRAASPTMEGPAVKDMNYYKNLIQQHGGGQRRDESKTRMVLKPCIYFKSPKGCRNGANCAYQHDTMPSQQRVGFITEVPSAKRVRLSR